MNDCLVTRLKGVVDNDSLPKLGEAIIEVDAGLNAKTVYIGTSLEIGGTVRLVGDGYFTLDGQQVKEVPMYTNGSSAKVLTTTGKVKLYIQPKYNVTNTYDFTYTVSAEDFKWLSANIQTLTATIIGDFDVANINPEATIDTYKFQGTGLYGDASFILQNTSADSIMGAPIRELFINNKMTADISKLNCTTYQMHTSNNPSTFKWKTTRDSSKPIIAFPFGVNFGNDLDAMLINQADCVVDKSGGERGTSVQYPDNYIINVNGTRTSSSDSAVSALKTKGFTVIVNGEAL